MLHRIMKWASIISFLILVPTLYAQDEPVIMSNSSLVVDLSNGGTVDVVYQATGAETVTITAHTLNNDVDTKLELYDESGRLLAYNDDAFVNLPGLIGTDSAIHEFILPAPGTYTIHVTSFNGLDRGLVELTITSTGGGGTASQLDVSALLSLSDDPKILFIDESLKVYLDGQSTVDLVYIASTAETISIYAASLDRNDEPVDSILELLDSDGVLLEENDDLTGANTDPGIENFQLPSAGVYTIRLSTFFGSPAGGVEVIVSSSAGSTVGGSEGECSSPSLAVGETITGSISGSRATTLTFCGEAGQTVNIIAIATNPPSTTQDLYMTIYNPDGSELAADDDSATNFQFDPAVNGLTLPATGQYLIEIISFDALSGDFDLTVEEA